MYQIFLIIQCISMVIIAAELFYIVSRKPSTLQKYMIIFFVSLLLIFVCYTIEMHQTTLEGALICVKLAYLGKPFITWAMFMCIITYCRIRLPEWLYYVLPLIQASVSVLVLTCSYHTLYYSSISFTNDGLFPHLIKGHGPLYSIFSIDSLVYCIVMLAICFVKAKTANTQRDKKQIHMFAYIVILTALFYVLYLLKVIDTYDPTLIGYFLATLGFSFSYIKLDLLDTITLAQEQAIEYINSGLFVYDTKGRLLFENSVAKDLDMDEDIKTIARAGETFSKNDRYYSADEQILTQKGIIYGSLILVNDVTDHHLYASELESEVFKQTQNLRNIQHKITLGMADIVESHDNITGGHVKRTSDVIKIFVERLKFRDDANPDDELNLSARFYNNVISAAPMHDLGKIAVEDAILRKPGKYTDAEYAEMKTHAEKGAKIVGQVLSGIEDDKFLKVATNIAHYHHEKWDGTGYPTGISGKDIPIEARIMALADVFDALVSKRHYKEQFSYDDAFNIIKDSLGSHFDPVLGNYFLECRKDLEAYYDSV